MNFRNKRRFNLHRETSDIKISVHMETNDVETPHSEASKVPLSEMSLKNRIPYEFQYRGAFAKKLSTYGVTRLVVVFPIEVKRDQIFD
jgi:hypothetical protein